ncbi:response regulator (plasmid) [Streptomyces sp. AHU1]|uniref:response regulator n=1 Tax=Streptomyces sp. AHU1 TaxID=3377215 RepID=UPI0038780DD7
MKSPIRVLLADDQELFRSGVALSIESQADMRVVGQAENGLQALELIGPARPDIVLMDLRMPHMDGVEATRRIFAPEMAMLRDHPMRVIVLTTFDLDDRAATAIRYGASGFLLKDATPDFLRSAIRTVHAGNSVLLPNDLQALFQQGLTPRTPLPEAYLSLTEKEREILRAVAEGMSNSEIARHVFLSESTVKTHVSGILRKLRLRDRVQIVVFAYQHGLCRARG